MGGRGARIGISDKGHKYGTEYTTLYQSGNIKFIKYNNSTATKAPMETMTAGRVYVTIDKDEDVKYINYFDKNNKRFKQIDIKGKKHDVRGVKIIPHTHKGYEHDERGTHDTNPKEKKMIDRVKKIWDNKLNNK